MGNLQAMEMASMVDDIDVALGWHLRSNHYPPVHGVFIDVAKEAIEKGARANVLAEIGMYDEVQEILNEEVDLPNGRVQTIGGVIEGLHLDAFVEQAALKLEAEDE